MNLRLAENGVPSLARRLGVMALGILAASCAWAAEEPDGLKELLYREASFHAHQNDHATAISRLRSAEDMGILPAQSAETDLQLARWQLAYGMHLEAGLKFHAALGEHVPEAQRNEAWYELARSLYYRGYSEAADEVLANIEGEIPDHIIGDYQLLRASILMSQDRNREAAEVLSDWRGAPGSAAYASYNRSVALSRSGQRELAKEALKKVIAAPAKDETLLALRDKARLSLAYIYAENERYDQADALLSKVATDSPFSNRALLASGWIAYKQGKPSAALQSWTELRGRSPDDPAVLETLLVIPAIERETNSEPAASQDYQAAISTYRGLLGELESARKSVRSGETVALLLESDSHTSSDAEDAVAREHARRFFGPLLASRQFRQVQKDHGELKQMLDAIDRDLEQATVVAAPGYTGDTAPPPDDPATGAYVVQGTARNNTGPTDSGENTRWIPGEAYSENLNQGEIPTLPEIELPPERELTPLPEKQTSRPRKPSFFALPPESQYIKQPPDPTITGMPDSEVIWLPRSGEFRRPGQEKVEDYAYPDTPPRRRRIPGQGDGYQLSELLFTQEEQSHFDQGAVPVGQALRDLAVNLHDTNTRINKLGSGDSYARDPQAMQQNIDSLRSRIAVLRDRIASAIELFEDYSTTIALNELEQRQQVVEGLLEQASLELAKTYDQSANPQ